MNMWFPDTNGTLLNLHHRTRNAYLKVHHVVTKDLAKVRTRIPRTLTLTLTLTLRRGGVR